MDNDDKLDSNGVDGNAGDVEEEDNENSEDKSEESTNKNDEDGAEDSNKNKDILESQPECNGIEHLDLNRTLDLKTNDSDKVKKNNEEDENESSEESNGKDFKENLG